MKTKKEEGITLVALILIVILLVILSAVGISVVYNSRIIEFAINGTQKYGQEGINENKILEGTENLLDSVVSNLKDIGGDVTTEEKYTATFYVYNNQSRIEKVAGEITLPSIENVTVDGITYTARGWATSNGPNAEVIEIGTKVEIKEDTTYYASYDITTMATFYYNSNTESGSITPTTKTGTETIYMNYIGEKIEETLKIPTEVIKSVGKYNSPYIGLSISPNSMTTTSEILAGNTYYAIYSSQVTIYYPSSTTSVTNIRRYRNEYFTNETTMTAVLASNTVGTTDITFSPSVGGYSFYGFATKENVNTRNYPTVARLRDSVEATVYTVLYKSESKTATFYYNSNTTIGEFTVATTTNSTNKMTYLRCRNITTATTSVLNSTVTGPVEVRNSIGKYNSNYVGVSSTLSSMTKGSTGYETYYAIYSTGVRIYYPNSFTTVTSRIEYRNEFFTSTTKMESVLASSNTSATNSNFSSPVSAYPYSEGYGLEPGFGVNVVNPARSDVTICYQCWIDERSYQCKYLYCKSTTEAGTY